MLSVGSQGLLEQTLKILATHHILENKAAYVFACEWAGAAIRVGRSSMWQGGGCIVAEQGQSYSEIIFSIDLRRPRFCVTDQPNLPTKGYTHL